MLFPMRVAGAREPCSQADAQLEIERRLDGFLGLVVVDAQGRRAGGCRGGGLWG